MRALLSSASAIALGAALPDGTLARVTAREAAVDRAIYGRLDAGAFLAGIAVDAPRKPPRI